ncbi:unnamed protein product [Camellia sinensis]
MTMNSLSLYSPLPSISNSRLDSSKTLIFLRTSSHGSPKRLSLFRKALRAPIIICSSANDSSDSVPSGENIPSSFCIIEGPETVQDFVQMQLLEIQDNIRSRRNKIFLLMEEVRRLRVQQRIKSAKKVLDENGEEEAEMPEIPSSIPFLPHVAKDFRCFVVHANMDTKDIEAAIPDKLFFRVWDYCLWGSSCTNKLELKLGIGGTSYEDFIHSMHLPMQLSQVDPIVASFSGGAVGVISALMILEANNVEQQEKKRCKYCHGIGYLACARCSASGVCLKIEPISVSNASDRPLHAPTTQRCLNCSGAGKVMCPTCLCTGMVMASEHDPRIDPFD